MIRPQVSPNMLRRFVPRLLLAAACQLFASALFAQTPLDVPLSFEPNVGQSAPEVKYLSHGKGYAFFLTPSAATLELGSGVSNTVSFSVVDGQTPTTITGEEALPGKVNYLRGDQAHWVRNVPTYARIRLSNVYPGVDLVYYGNHRQLEYDFVVRPGANVARVGLQAQGASELKVAADGSLSVRAGGTQWFWHAPVAYQVFEGHRHAVEARYEVIGSTIRFTVGTYDHARELVVDPVLVYSSYVGGNGGDVGDVGNAIAVDASGNAYVAGVAASTNFPTTGRAMQTSPRGNDDAFVAKLNPQGTAYIYSTYLGGGGQDIAYAIAVNAAGEAFVTGQTGSGLYGTAAFPTTAGAYQRKPNDGGR